MNSHRCAAGASKIRTAADQGPGRRNRGGFTSKFVLAAGRGDEARSYNIACRTHPNTSHGPTDGWKQMRVMPGDHPMAEPTVGENPPPSAAASAQPIVPGYEILEELGRGGIGVVYKARQLNTERLVALKLLRDGALAGQTERARFRIEAEVAARMRHVNFVQLLEVGEHLGQTYLAMELIDG